MKKLILVLSMLVAGMSILQSCKKDREPDFVMSNQEFVTQAASSHMLEMMAGNLAATDAQLDTVKNYGSFLAQSHAISLDQLETLIAQKDLTIPTQMNSIDQSNYNLLDDFSADEFDESFLQLMLLSHQNSYALYHAAAQYNGVPDPQLRAWAAQKLASIEMHFEEAEELYNTVRVQ